MNLKEFDSLSARDFENGAILEDIRAVIKSFDALKIECEKAKGKIELLKDSIVALEAMLADCEDELDKE